MAKKYSLVFGRTSDEQGFRSSKGSISRFPEASIITRELIQNALDANETGKVEISFKVDSIPLKDLPGLNEYKKAFDAAKKESKPGDKNLIARIEEQLEQKTVRVLWVTDNGSGLDTENMKRLLADGGSKKVGKAGSYGLGHLAAFRASTLNYVIYGGCSKDEQILSGQCIIATYYKGDKMYSANGYLCLNDGGDEPRKRKFPAIDEIAPGLWKDKLAQIKKKGTGSFVCISAFNNFGGDRTDSDVEKEILYEAASSFLPAIFEGKMEVQVGDYTLRDKEALEKILFDRKPEVNKRKDSLFGTSGSNFYNLYTCMNLNEVQFEVPALGNESVRVFMDLTPENGRRSIHLFRHGMWITHKVPHLEYNEFGGYKPFTAMILVDKDKALDTGILIAKAEGERHMQIRRDELNSEEDAALKDILERVRDRIKKEARQISKDAEPIPFVDFGVEGGGVYEMDENAPSRPKRQGEKKPTVKPPGPINPKPDGPEPDHKKRYVRGARKLPIPCTIPVFEDGMIRFIVRADKQYDNVEMRVVAKSGSDQSCALPLPDEFVYLAPESKKNGKEIQEDKHVPEFEDSKENYVAVKLGRVSKEDIEISLKPAATPPLAEHI
ncbi:MAG: hypothetical protein ISN29_09605 [Gammaproteobacteria bacterium AqS3]|nr:hypothetical protein [Gammaproteobacteria bacterium AqS3]